MLVEALVFATGVFSFGRGCVCSGGRSPSGSTVSTAFVNWDALGEVGCVAREGFGGAGRVVSEELGWLDGV